MYVNIILLWKNKRICQKCLLTHKKQPKLSDHINLNSLIYHTKKDNRESSLHNQNKIIPIPSQGLTILLC